MLDNRREFLIVGILNMNKKPALTILDTQNDFFEEN